MCFKYTVFFINNNILLRAYIAMQVFYDLIGHFRRF